MTVINLQSEKADALPRHCVLCLGNFDGVHIGHRELIFETLNKKRELSNSYPDIKSGAWFFRHNPHDVISGRATPLITDMVQKLKIFASFGLDYAFICDYEDIGRTSPSDFVKNVLKAECNCVFSVCGYDFKFGADAAGDANLLLQLMDGKASIIPCVKAGHKKVSSSEIRKLIFEGNISEANSLLGRNFEIHGKVLHGKKLGRTLEIPTVNQELPHDIVMLKRGIYISRTTIFNKKYPSVSNIGLRPSVENTNEANCETYIIDFNGDIYGEDVSVEFIQRIRDEKKFENVELLKAQVQNDIKEAKTYFSKISGG